MRGSTLATLLPLLGVVLAPCAVMAGDMVPAVAMTGLERRLTPDVPRFVGPASMRVHGAAGTYRWDEVHFGAHDVTVRVTTLGGETPCQVRLRLVEGGERVHVEEFPGEAPEKSVYEGVVDVGYATASLRVESTCAAWSLRLGAVEDPELPYELTERYYPVRADSLRGLAEQTQHIRGRWAAWTEWFTSWQLGFEEDETSCSIAHGDTNLEATITYPVWTPPDDADPDVIARWDRFVESLREHELGHVTIALQGAAAIDDRLDQGLSAATCDEAAEVAADAARRILERHNRRSERYDRDTGHGLTQGTGLP